MRGERLADLVCRERTKLAAGVVLLAPFIPLMFMGEEYGETTPFPYFISHSDPDLIEIVRRGRREEFAAFGWSDEPPDPQDEETFMRAKLNHSLRGKGNHRVLLELYGELFQLRKGIPALGRLSKDDMEVMDFDREKVLVLRRGSDVGEAIVVFHFGESPTSVRVPFPKGKWRKRLDSADERWKGPGSQLPTEIISRGEVALGVQPYAFVLFVGEREF
jgi:maltooligosyltrehalose trehalohydrolase